MKQALEDRARSCLIVEADTVGDRGGLSWSPDTCVRPSVRDREGSAVDVERCAVIWWRRLTGEVRFQNAVLEPAARDLAARDTRAALTGIMLNAFKGAWVSDPEATRLAENKVLQLAVAAQCGFRLPKTIVSSDPKRVREFCDELNYAVIVKAVAGTPMQPVMTGRVSRELLADERAIQMSPAIYQEFIPGAKHLRVNVFGEHAYTALLETEQLDWRYPLNCSATPYDLDSLTVQKLARVLEELHLAMGVFDLKLGANGEPFWFEVNPQGQFLWLEALCGLPLTQAFADFLESKIQDAALTR